MKTSREHLLERVSVLLLAICLLLAGCAGSNTDASTGSSSVPLDTSPTSSSSSATTTPTNEIAELVDVGDGKQLFLRCTGEGSPTVLFEAGDNNMASDWGVVFSRIGAETRACAYDRAGLGSSTQASGCRDVDDLLGDLESLLVTAEVEGPFVLVGHSGGGFLMAEFAARHVDEVAGLVLVETPKALTGDLYPEVLPLIDCDAPGNVEHRDFLSIEHAVWDSRSEIGDFPMVVISNDWGPTADRDESTNVEDQRGWMILSPNSKQVVVTTGHDVPRDNPDVVIRQIRAVLNGNLE